MKTQLTTSEKLKSLVKNIKEPLGVHSLKQIRDLVFDNLKFIPYTKDVSEKEKLIRWKRTATQILDDGYVYKGKACTDLVILFLSLCKEVGIKGMFVKVKKDKMLHSLAEIKINNEWYIFDIANEKDPQKGVITKGKDYKGWKLLGKGKDSWELGLTGFDKINILK